MVKYGKAMSWTSRSLAERDRKWWESVDATDRLSEVDSVFIFLPSLNCAGGLTDKKMEPP